MCGRFAYYNDEQIRKLFPVSSNWNKVEPDYNIAPGRMVQIIIGKENEPTQVKMQWGFIPSWAKSEKDGISHINTRSESIFTKPTWIKAVKKSRCIIPANGYYEWDKIPNQPSQPYYITNQDNALCFAGIYNVWKKETGELLYSFSIITKQASPNLYKIHNRMPCTLDKEDIANWQCEAIDTEEILNEILNNDSNEELMASKVSKEVNNTKNNFPELITKE